MVDLQMQILNGLAQSMSNEGTKPFKTWREYKNSNMKNNQMRVKLIEGVVSYTIREMNKYYAKR